jgi:hypothetical protein
MAPPHPVHVASSGSRILLLGEVDGNRLISCHVQSYCPTSEEIAAAVEVERAGTNSPVWDQSWASTSTSPDPVQYPCLPLEQHHSIVLDPNSHQLMDETWQEFFRRQAAGHTRYLARESVAKRQLREIAQGQSNIARILADVVL